MPIRRLTVAATLAVVLLLLAAAGISLAAGMMYREAPLTPGGMAYEVNTDAAGNLFVSDYDAKEIWQFQPTTSAYTRYQNLPPPSNASPDGAGNIWFTDWRTTVGRINMLAETMTTWTVEGSQLGGLALDGNGRIWVASRSSPPTGAAVYRFDPQTAELCGYEWQGGSDSEYVLYSDGYVWLADRDVPRIIRFDPSAAQDQVRWWSLPPGPQAPSTRSRNASPHSRSPSPPLPSNSLYQKGELLPLPEGPSPRGLAVDAAGHLWWTDLGANALATLDPGNAEVTTYSLPAGSNPEMLILDDGRAWYTTISGTVGALDPAVAAGTAATAATGSLTLTSTSCASLGTGTTTTASSAQGHLPWGPSAELLPILDSDGWTIYQLPYGADLYGIARSSGSLWVADSGRQKLVRLRAVEPGRLFLPLVLDKGM